MRKLICNWLSMAVLLALVMPAWAQPANQQAALGNSIENLQVSKAAGSTILQVSFRQALAAQPSHFSIANPARLVFDLPDTSNALGFSSKTINEGGLRSLNIVQAGDRSRLVLNLEKTMRFEMRQEDRSLLISLSDEIETTAVSGTAQPVQHFVAGSREDGQLIRDIQFRRSKEGAGVIAVDLSASDTGIDVRQKGTGLYVTFKNTKLPDQLRRQLDVVDFATPVTSVKTKAVGADVNMEILPQGLWEHIAFQTDNQFVIEVKPVKEDPNKLFQGTKTGYQGEAISLNFQNIPLRELLHVFADITNFNIVVSDSVTGNVSLRLNDVPWDHALEIVLQQKNLAMRKSGNVLWIAPRDELAARDKTEAEAREAAVAAEVPRMEVFQLNYQKAEDVATMLTQTNQNSAGGTGGQGQPQQAGSFTSAQGRVTVDKRTNQLFIFDVPTKLDLVRGLLAKIDRPVRQVMIEARIVEADTNFTKQLGVKIGTHDHQGMNVGHKIGGKEGFRFGLSGSNQDAYAHLPEFGRYPATAIITDVDQTTGEITYTREVPTPVLADSQLVNLGVTNPAGQIALTLMNAAKTQLLSLELSALEADGKGKIVSSPRIMTMDQVKANIQQGIRIPYLTQSASGATAVAWQNANLSLEVTPQITPDGKVMMELKITKNALGQFISTLAGYSIKTKELDSKVLVDNGGTVVIGGIYEQEEIESVRRVPLLGDLPYVGFLFKQREKRDNRVELLIMITPKVIDNALALK